MNETVLYLLPILLGVLFLIAHLISDKIHIRHQPMLTSFSVGISLAYIFLYLFPEMLQASRFDSMSVFSSVLLGIAIIRLVEIHVWKHRSKAVLKKELKEVHAVSFFIYHFVIGMVLFELLKFSVIGGILFFLPALLHSAVSSTSLKEIHDEIRAGASRVLLALSTLLGISIMYFVSVPASAHSILLGFVVGVLLYIVMRDSMPKESAGKPLHFLAGILLYALLILIFKLVAG